MELHFKQVEGMDLTDRSVMIAEELRRSLFERILGGVELIQICSEHLGTAAGLRRKFYLEQLEKLRGKLYCAIEEWPDDSN
jgi:hypothetical protein